MNQATVEERLDRLERIVENVLDHISSENGAEKDWRRTIGMFDGDPIMEEVIDEAVRQREVEREQFYQKFDEENGKP